MNGNRTRQQLHEDVLKTLGHPVVRVNLSPEQVDSSINWALKIFWKYHRNGSFENYYIYKLTEEDVQRGWVAIPKYIDAVVEVLPRTFAYNDFSFATMDWQMQREAFLSLNRFSAVSAVEYTSVMQRVYNLGHVLGQDVHPFDFVRYQRRLLPRFKIREDELLVMRVYENVDPERTDPGAIPCDEVWDDETLKNLAVCRCKQQWGLALSKFANVQLPGGVVLNGADIYQQGKDEEDALMEEMRNEQPIDFFMG